MAGLPERENTLEQLLVDLKTAAGVPAKQRAIGISSIIDKICSTAYEDGLSNASLEEIVDIITVPNHLDQASTGSLIKNLYPVTKVPDTAVIKVIGSLGHGRAKPSFTAQTALLKWLVMVYDVMENQRVLSQLYSVFFNLLDTIAIRTPLCHVLSLITRRKHVRPFRIQVLMELTRQAGNDPPLVGLMRVYKDYYPDVIVGEVTSGRASVFTHPNHEWRQRLREIQDVYLQRTQDGRLPEQRNFRAARRGMNSAKRVKIFIVPEVHTSDAQESSVTLEEIENASEFVDKLEKIELPNQLVAAIGDPLLQRFLLLKPSNNTFQRIDHWLRAFFEDQLETPGSEKVILEILEAVRNYTNHAKSLLPACLKYLRSMIYSWNGITGRQVVLDLLAYTPIGPWEELYESTFQPLEDAVLEDGTVESKLVLLTFYKSVLQQWALSLLSEPQKASTPSLSITSLIDHGNILALTIIQSSLTVGTCSKVIDFYETITSLLAHPNLSTEVRITIPPAELVYTLFFTPSLSIVSRLCSVLALYKRAFELAMAAKANLKQYQSYPKDYVNHFNGFLMDLCNCLWRSKAFSYSDVNALGCLLSQPVIETLTKYVSSLDTSVSLPILFSLSYSPILCQLAILYVRELEDNAEDEINIRHAGPVTQSSLKELQKGGGINLSWPDYRLGVLQYLENEGTVGIGELMYNTMKNLMTARENRA